VLPNPDKHRRHDAVTVARLEVEEEGGPLERAAQALGGFSVAVDTARVAQAAGLDTGLAGEALEELARLGRAWHLDDGRFLAAGVGTGLEERLLQAARSWQVASSFRWGPARGDLKSQLPREIDPQMFDHLTGRLTAAGRLFQRDDRFRADDAGAPLGERDAARLRQVRTALAGGQYAPPTVKELEADPALARDLPEILAALTADGEVVKVAADFYYPRATLDAMGSGIGGFFGNRGEMRVADLKDLFGISRKHAVPVLEYFDRLGVTRRLGDVRVAGRLLSGGDGRSA